MSNADPDRSSLNNSLEIDQICDEFERLQMQNENPRIEDFFPRVDQQLQTRLFEQLLALELELTDERPIFLDYTNRFPAFASQVEEIFEELDLLDWTGTSIGHFEIVNEIARGGMGVVYLAKDTRLDRDVAIKLLTRGRRTEMKWLRRFRREARLASSLNHPNILTIYEIGEDQETPYIVSEFVNGKTLREIVAEQELRLNEVVDYAWQVANGMVAAHQAGIIHRDLKADNVMIRSDGIAKILDFGLAKTNQLETPDRSLESRTGAISGTIHFMSPEQARGEKLSTKSDVFSFGVLLYFMVTGRLPFSAKTISDVLVAILTSEPEKISTFEVSTPSDLDSLIFDCLQKSIDKRPSFEHVLLSLNRLRKTVNEATVLENDDFLGEGVDHSTTQTFGQQLSGTIADLQPSMIRYAQSGDVNIAWQEIGSGPIDIVFVMGWVSHLDWFWKDPSFANFLCRLASFARVILFDKRGTGLSDKVPLKELPDLETRMDDVRAVMDASGSEQAVLCGISEGGPLCALFSATYPNKTIALTMIGSYSRRLWAEDYPWGPTAEEREVFLEQIRTNWGGPLGLEDRAPSKANDPDFRDWWASYLRMGASPNAAVALTKMNAQIDIRPILSSIHVPTLVIHRTGDKCLQIEEGRYLAEQIPGAKFVEMPGDDHLPFVGDADKVLREIELFLTGMTRGIQADCVLATVLCIEILDPDKSLAVKFQGLAEREVALFRGQNLLADGRFMLMTFDGPVRSILCATAICKLAKRIDLKIKCGLDTGTCNIDKSKIYGPAVDGANAVARLAGESKIFLTHTLRNLISGPDIQFEQVAIESDRENKIDSLFEVVFV